MNMEGYTPGEPVVVTPGRRLDFQPSCKGREEVTEDIENYTFGEMARGCTPSSGTSSATGTSSLPRPV